MVAREDSASRPWDEIIRFSNGSPEDKVKALRTLFSKPQLFKHYDVIELVKRLSRPTEPESVRLELAAGIESREITYGTYKALIELSSDPSEVVREQARISRARHDAYVEDVETKVRLIRPRLWRIRSSRRWLGRQRLPIAVITALGLGVSTAYVTLHLSIPLPTDALLTLSQVNATIFALAFTIPLAASQFARYPSSPESFLDKMNLFYFATYGLTTFLAFVAPLNTIIPAIALGLSVSCTALLVPYLFRTSQKLRSAQIVSDEHDKVIRRWREGTEEGLAESGSQLENLARIALGLRDYSTFEAVLGALVSLVRESMQLPVRSRYSPLQPGAAGVRQALHRIGEASLDDSLAVDLWCSKVLDLATHKSFVVDDTGGILKYVEHEHLSQLSTVSSIKAKSLGILLLALVDWAVFNRAGKLDRGLDWIGRCAYTLSGFPVEVVDEAFIQSKLRIKRFLILFEPVSLPVRPFMFSHVHIVRRHLEEMHPKLETEFSKIALEEMLEPVAIRAQIVIELAGPEDSIRITLLQRVCYSAEAIVRNDWQIPPLVETSHELALELKNSAVFKARADGVIVGSVKGKLETNRCLISRLFVHPKFRRQGIGSKLLAEMENRFPGAKILEVYAGINEPERVGFLQKRGYSAKLTRVLSNGIELLYMEKSRSTPSNLSGDK